MKSYMILLSHKKFRNMDKLIRDKFGNHSVADVMQHLNFF